jgi:hypothetical protein
MAGEATKAVHPDNYPSAELQGLFGEQFGSFESFKTLVCVASADYLFNFSIV